MSLFGIHILTDAALAHLKAAGHAATAALASPTQAAVAALLDTPLGKAVVADVHTVADQALSGTGKFEKVLANTLPALVGLFASGGVTRTIDEVEDIGRELVQTAYDAFKSTSAGTVAADILHLLGVG